MLRDDGVQTFRAKEKATGRELELHLFLPFGRPENKTLFEKLKSLPLEARRSFLDIGFDGSTPYVVTDPLAGGRGFKSWAEELIGGGKPPASTFNPATLNAAPSRDDGVQILQAGQWRTGTPIPDSLITKPPVVPPTAAPIGTGDFTRMFQAPSFLKAPDAPEQPPAGEFTGLFQAQTLKPVPPPAAPEPPGGEFTRMFKAPSSLAEPSSGVEFTKYFENPLKPAPMGSPQPMIESPPPPPPAGGPRAGEFTDIFGKPTGSAPSPPPPGAVFGAMPSATGQFSAQPSWSQPQAQPSFASGPSEYTKMMSAPQLSASPGPSVFNAPPNAAAQSPAKKSNAPLFIAIGVVVLLLIAIVLFLVLRTAPTIPAAK
jgi:hypothetical protein